MSGLFLNGLLKLDLHVKRGGIMCNPERNDEMSNLLFTILSTYLM